MKEHLVSVFKIQIKPVKVFVILTWRFIMLLLFYFESLAHHVIFCPFLQVEVQSLLVAEVVGGAKTMAKKSILKNLSHLWEEVS